MNTITVPPPSASSVETPSDALALATLDGRSPRTSLIDRIALRLAVALLLWSSRPTARTQQDRDAVLLARHEAADREARERRWLLRAHNLPIR